MKENKLSYYIDIAKAVACMSKDPRTKVGAVVVGAAGEIRSTGYNGQARGLDDGLLHRQSYPTKALYFAHAEENAIVNAARVGVPLQGSSIVATKAPCCTCMRMIINAGIVAVYAPAPEQGDWFDNCTEAINMALEADVIVVDTNLIEKS
jgi:dCMP deaminase